MIFSVNRTVELTSGKITPALLRFALPMFLGAALQQCYNIADMLIVGQFIGAEALAAVGSSYTLLIFITSLIIGFTLGSGTLFSLHYGAGNFSRLRRSIFVSVLLIGAVAVVINIGSYLFLTPILHLLRVPPEVFGLMKSYLLILFGGLLFVFVYNFYASILRGVGDSFTPLCFLALSIALNILLDILFVLVWGYGVEGVAWATVISQFFSALSLAIYTLARRPDLRIKRSDMQFDMGEFKEILTFSSLTCVQQSVMNFGILLVQGLVNSFGTSVMAAFSAAVKVDSFAYMPAQEFGNAFSTFVAQNYGAKMEKRLSLGVRKALIMVLLFSVVVSLLVFIFAEELMGVFVPAAESEIIGIGREYLRIEGSFYLGIGILFLLYGYYRAIRRPAMSLILTIFSLGTRVLLAYILARIPSIGVVGIWWSIPIGWALADLVGVLYYRYLKR